jgi:AraC family transcriptional regulator, regulatory protein of adaptative response / DNA-3-methyladenine glycosylase II
VLGRAGPGRVPDARVSGALGGHKGARRLVSQVIPRRTSYTAEHPVPAGTRPENALTDAPVTVRLRYQPPYGWAAMLGHLEARAIEGVEEVRGATYRRTVASSGLLGSIEVRHEPSRGGLAVTVRFPSVDARPSLMSRVRCVFDVGADPETIGRHLSRDPSLAPLVALRPGLRVPGGWEGFELAVRAVLGQQVTVVAARRLAGRLVALCGPWLPEAARPSPALSRFFPSPEHVAAADLGPLGMPGARRATLKALAEAALHDPDLFRPRGSLDEAVARLRAIRGVGEWTAQYIALRALRESDAFPANDVGLLRGAAGLWGHRPTAAELLRRAEPWRPWRAYAAQHLWAADAAVASLGAHPVASTIASRNEPRRKEQP